MNADILIAERDPSLFPGEHDEMWLTSDRGIVTTRTSRGYTTVRAQNAECWFVLDSIRWTWHRPEMFLRLCFEEYLRETRWRSENLDEAVRRVPFRGDWGEWRVYV